MKRYLMDKLSLEFIGIFNSVVRLILGIILFICAVGFFIFFIKFFSVNIIQIGISSHKENSINVGGNHENQQT